MNTENRYTILSCIATVVLQAAGTPPLESQTQSSDSAWARLIDGKTLNWWFVKFRPADRDELLELGRQFD